MILAGLLVLGTLLPVAPAAQSDAAAPSASKPRAAPTDAKRIKLTPILKPAPKVVTLKPISKGAATSAPLTTPTQIVKSVETAQARQAAPDTTATLVVAAVPVKLTVKPPATPRPTPSPTPTPEPTPTVTPQPTPSPTPTPEPTAEATVAAAPAARQTPLKKHAARSIASPRRRPATPAATAEATPAETPAPKAAPASRRIHIAGTGLEKLLDAPASPQARMDLRRYLEANVDSPEVTRVLLRIGQIGLELNDPVGARKAFETAERIADTAPQRQAARLGLARTATAGGDFDRAMQLWKQLATDAPELMQSPEALAGQAATDAAVGDLNAAEQGWAALARGADALSGDEADVWRRKARLGEALTTELRGRPAEARRLYQRIAEQAASSEEAALARQRIEDLNQPLVTTAWRSGVPAAQER